MSITDRWKENKERREKIREAEIAKKKLHKEIKEREKEQRKVVKEANLGKLRFGINQLAVVLLIPVYIVYTLFLYLLKSISHLLKRVIPDRYIVKFLIYSLCALATVETMKNCPYDAVWFKIAFFLFSFVGLSLIGRIFYEPYKIVDAIFYMKSIRETEDRFNFWIKLKNLNDRNIKGTERTANWIIDEFLYFLENKALPGVHRLFEYVIAIIIVLFYGALLFSFIFRQFAIYIGDVRVTGELIWSVPGAIISQIGTAINGAALSKDYFKVASYIISAVFLFLAVLDYVWKFFEGIVFNFNESIERKLNWYEYPNELDNSEEDKAYDNKIL